MKKQLFLSLLLALLLTAVLSLLAFVTAAHAEALIESNTVDMLTFGKFLLFG